MTEPGFASELQEAEYWVEAESGGLLDAEDVRAVAREVVDRDLLPIARRRDYAAWAEVLEPIITARLFDEII